MTPIILVTGDVRVIDGNRWHAGFETYLKAVEGIGGAPLILPNVEGVDLDAVLARVDGVVVTGSRSNVHPSRYAVEPSEKHEPYDLDRDSTTMQLIPMAIRAGVPLFAICRGFQELNVALGGSLITEAQERPGSLDHRSLSNDNDERYKLAHDVTFEPGSELAKLLKAGCVRVNSVHRQVVDRLAPGLAVEARAPDGTIEAVRVVDAVDFAFGVQWHPEYWSRTDGPSAALFQAFGDAARGRARHLLPMAAE
jgi:putative glutamine amidotransferase